MSPGLSDWDIRKVGESFMEDLGSASNVFGPLQEGTDNGMDKVKEEDDPHHTNPEPRKGRRKL
jgi:hypothetical protein